MFSIISRQQMLNTKNVLMLVVLSAGMLTGLTATGMSLGQTAFASGDEDKNQKIDQENNCKIVIENRHGNDNEQNDNENNLNCQNQAQNAQGDNSVDGDPFDNSGSD
jgi:hypothetical protein